MATTTSRPRLAATARTITGKHVARLRRAGQLPGVVYGRGVESRNVSLDAHEFELFRKHSGANTLFDLAIDSDRPAPALVHGVQVHPLTRRPVHVDLLAVRMTEELVVDVPIVTVGIAPAQDRDNGTLTHITNTIRVRALPDHLPQSIEVSVESLDSFDVALHVRDLTIPSDVTVLNDPDEVLVRVLPPRVEVEVGPPAEEGAEAPSAEAEAEGAAASGAASGSGSAEGSSES